MLGVRDIGWALFLCLVLTLLLQCRPTWEARRFLERESRAGFLEAYAGHRYLSGEAIGPDSSFGLRVDPMATAVMTRRFEITAEKISLTGNGAEFVARQLIQLADGSPGGADASQEVHVRIAKQDGHFVYTRFEVRGQGEIDEPNAANPWARAIRNGRAEQEHASERRPPR